MSNNIKGFRFNGNTYKYDYNSLENIPNLQTDKTLTATDRPADAKAVGDEIASVRSAVGSPLVAATASAMTDRNKVYVYTGSESGYTNGNWYYHNGSTWTSGGVYNSSAVNTDTTLSVSGKAADAKKTGDEITDLKGALRDIDDNIYYQNWSENKKYIVLNQSTANINSPASTSSNVRYIVIPCQSGDVFTITSTGGSASRAWGFVDVSGNVLDVAKASYSYQDYIKVAPVDSAYLVVNDTTLAGYVVSGVVIKERIATLEKKKVYPIVWNVINKNDADYYEGYVDANGVAHASISYRTTGYIPCTKNEVYSFSTKANLSTAIVSFYNASKVPSGAEGSNSFAVNPLIVPDRYTIAYMRVSVPVEAADHALYNTDYPIDIDYAYNQRIVLSDEVYAGGNDYITTILKNSAQKSSKSGSAVLVYPVNRTKPSVKLVVDTPVSETRNLNVMHYGKNGAVNATSASITANAETGHKYMAVPAYFVKGQKYAISFKQDVSIASSVHSRIALGFTAVASSTINLLSPNYYTAGKHVFIFQSPYTSFANVSYYYSGIAEALNITEFQIEPVEYTSFETVQKETITVELTPQTESIDIPYSTIFDGYNVFGTALAGTHIEVDYYEKESVFTEETVPWSYACGKIAFIGDSLTAGLYAPVSVGEILEGYPYYLGRMLNAETLVCAKSGGDPEGFYTGQDGYSAYDFSEYDTVILWLGTNGGMRTSDIGVTGTESYYYEEIIKGIKSQKNDILIFVGTVFTTGPLHSETTYPSENDTNGVVYAMAEKYDLPVLDFSDLNASGYRLLHNMQNNTHMGKAGNIYIANRIKNTMQEYFEEDMRRIEFGLLPKSTI